MKDKEPHSNKVLAKYTIAMSTYLVIRYCTICLKRYMAFIEPILREFLSSLYPCIREGSSHYTNLIRSDVTFEEIMQQTTSLEAFLGSKEHLVEVIKSFLFLSTLQR
jgi:hypothetical protein